MLCQGIEACAGLTHSNFGGHQATMVRNRVGSKFKSQQLPIREFGGCPNLI